MLRLPKPIGPLKEPAAYQEEEDYYRNTQQKERDRSLELGNGSMCRSTEDSLGKYWPVNNPASRAWLNEITISPALALSFSSIEQSKCSQVKKKKIIPSHAGEYFTPTSWRVQQWRISSVSPCMHLFFN